MALAATTVWEVRTTGSDNSGGGFNTARGGGGSDLSQQDAAQQSWDGSTNVLSTSGAGVTTLTSNNSLFTSAMVGNIIQITAGTNFQTGFYEITAFTNGTTVTLDRTPSSGAAGSAGAGAVGGALATPGKAGAAHVAGNFIYVKSGTYSITSASTNVASGCPSLTAGTAANNTKLFGYGTSRGDNGTKPLLQASGISTFSLVTLAAGCRAENISVDGAGLTSSKGFSNNASASCYRCKAANCTNNGFNNGTNLLCEATGCSSQAAFQNGTLLYCVADSNTISGFNASLLLGCIASNNSGGSSDGFTGASGQWIDCTAYGNGRAGFRITADVQTIKTQTVTCAAGVTVLASVGTAATSTAQTGDCFARLGAPAGASIAADLAEIEGETDLLLAGVIVTTNNDKTGYSLAGNVTVGGYAAGQDPATLVLDVTASSHNTAGTIGAKINSGGGGGGGGSDPLLNQVPGNYAPGTAGAKIGLLGSASVSVVGPVATSGAVAILQGDSYFNADSRALTWTNAAGTWPNLSGATVTLVTYPNSGNPGLSKAAVVTVPSGANQSLYVELSSTDTSGAEPGSYPYHVLATLASGHVATLAQGTFRVQVR